MLQKELAVQKLRASGFRLTPQRLAVIGWLSGNRDHPTAREIHVALKDREIGLTLATVYNTLSALRSIGMVTGVGTGEGERFDPDEETHAHLVCERCGKVADIPLERLPELPENPAAPWIIQEIQVNFTGLCPECAANETGSR